MEKRTKGCLIAGTLAYLAIAAVLVGAKLVEREDMHSSPAVSRDTPDYRSGSLGILKDATRTIREAIPATEEMPVPGMWPGIDDSFLLGWDEQRYRDGSPGTPPDPWVAGLEGDDELEFVAYGTWFPRPDDPLPEDEPKSFSFTFRHPETLEPVSAEQLEDMGVPASMTRMEPPREYHTPRLRLLLRARGMEFVRCNGINVGDSRTSARVGYDLERLNEMESRSASSGEWTSVDAALLIWHDSPLLCKVEVLTGEPRFASLPRKFGEQVAFDESLRVQWLAESDASFDAEDGAHASFTPDESRTGEGSKGSGLALEDFSGPGNQVSYLLKKEPEDESSGPVSLVRASSSTLLEEHCAILGPEGPAWTWDRLDETGRVMIAEGGMEAIPPGDTLELVFLPHRTELDFPIAGIPDAPNPRGIGDLFEAKIPRITLDSNLGNAESHLIGYISVATQVEWDSSRRWDDHPPTNLPDDFTFRNETPQSLLNWYLDNTRGSFAIYEEERQVILVNEREEGWWSDFLEKVQRWMP